MKTFQTDRNNLFIREASSHTARVKIRTILEDDGVCKVYESAIIQVATSGPVVQAAVEMVV